MGVQNARHPMEQPSYRKTAVPRGFDPLADRIAKLPLAAPGETVQAAPRVTEYFDRPYYGKQYGYGDGYQQQYGGYGQPYGGYGGFGGFGAFGGYGGYGVDGFQMRFGGYGQRQGVYGGYGQQYGGYEQPHVNTYPTEQAPVASQYADDELTYANVPVVKEDPVVGTKSRSWMTDLRSTKKEAEGDYTTGYTALDIWTPVKNYGGSYDYSKHFTDKTYAPGYSKGDWSIEKGYDAGYAGKGYAGQGYGAGYGYQTGTAVRAEGLSAGAKYNWHERSLEKFGLNGDLAREVNPVTADGIRFDKYGPQVTPVQFTPARYTRDGVKADPALEYPAPTEPYRLYEAPYVPSMSSAVDLKTYEYTGPKY